MLIEGCKAQKRVWATIECKHCEREGRYEVEVMDTNAAVKAAQLWLNQGFGNPRDTPVEEQSFEFKRVIVTPE